MTGTEEVDLESIWNETDDDGNVISSETDTGSVDEESTDASDVGDTDSVEGDAETDAEDTSDDATDGLEDDGGAEDEVDYKALWQKEKQRADSAAGRLRAEADRREREKAAQVVAPAQTDAPKASAPAPTEEDEFLNKFQEEYSPEVIKAINILAARQAAQIVDQTIQTRVAPVERTTLDMVEQAHFSAIEAAHPDVFDIDESPEFEAWIESRPAHTRGAYQYVREKGTPAEVISMLNEYKAATRKTTTTAPPKEKVQAAMGVQRRRGTTPVASEPSQTDEKALWDSIPD